MKVLLTGATGFVGSHLAEHLIKKGYEVRCLVRTSSNLRWIADLDVECHYGSVFNMQSLKSALKDVDYVFHAAGLTKALKPYEFTEVNETGTKNLVQAVLESDRKLKRFVFISSQAAVGPSPGIEPIDESHTPNPVTAYGRSKLEAEKIVNSIKDRVPVTIVRPPAVYGPRDKDVLEFFKTVKMGLIPKFEGKEKYVSMIHVQDLVRGIVLAGTRKKAEGKTYFITSPRPYTWDKIGVTALQYFKKKGIRINVPAFFINGLSFAADGLSRLTGKVSIVSRERVIDMKQDFWVCSPRRAKEDFKFEAKISLEDGINETLSWYQKNNWL